MSVLVQNAALCCPRTAEKRACAMNGGHTHAKKAAVYYRKRANVRPAGEAGVNMTGQGYVNGELKIDMIHPQQIEPEMEGTHTGDYIVLKGTPNVSMAINPEVDGGIGTIAMMVNMIPHVINARPGLKTMLDLPVPRAIMGDMRDMIEK